jgi:Tol biopolymer transport system component
VLATAPAWSPDGRRLAFSSQEHDGLFVSRADGRGARQIAAPCRGASLATCGDLLDDPTWAPDGRRLAFVELIGDCDGPPGLTAGCDNGSAGDAGYALEVVNRDGTHRHRLFTSIVRVARNLDRVRPTWSPDGRTIVYASPTSSPSGGCGGSALWAVSPDGTHHRPLIQTCHLGLRSASAPDWSPDGRHLAFAAGSGDVDYAVANVYVVDRQGRHLRQVTRNKPPPSGCLPCPPDVFAESPSWSPDGKSIVYAASMFRQGSGGIWTVDATGGHRHQVVQVQSSGEPTWRPRP